MNHKIIRRYGGKNEMAWIQPTCVCGWEGEKQYAHNNYQRRNLMEEEIAHHAKAVARNEK